MDQKYFNFLSFKLNYIVTKNFILLISVLSYLYPLVNVISFMSVKL